MIFVAEAMLIEADGPCILAVGVFAVRYRACGRCIAVHEAITDRRAVHGAVIHIAACLIKIAVVRRVVLATRTAPLSLLAVIRGGP